jgi:F0F1-type ATP synthase delta subunit
MLVKIITIILKNTYTTDDLLDRLGLMRRYYEALLFKKQKDENKKNLSVSEFFEGEREVFTVQILEEWFNSFEKSKIAPLVVYEALDSIEEDISGLPTVSLYVPIRFSEEHISRFGEWFRKNVQPNVLLSVRVDSRVTGGCGVVWNDAYHDFSLRYYLHKHRKELLDVYEKNTTYAE